MRAHSKGAFREFFLQSLLYGRKRHLIRIRIYEIFRKCCIHSNAHHIIFSICFKFMIPKDRFCDVYSFSFSFLLLKISFKNSVSISQESVEETLICAIW